MESSYLTFIGIQLTDCHVMRDLGVGNLETDYKQFYICVYVCVCMCVVICMCVRLHVCGYMYVYMCMCICIYICMCMCMGIFLANSLDGIY